VPRCRADRPARLLAEGGTPRSPAVAGGFLPSAQRVRADRTTTAMRVVSDLTPSPLGPTLGFVPPTPASRHKPTVIRTYPPVFRWTARSAATADGVPKLPANGHFLLPSAERVRAGRLTNENRGVGGSSPPLAIPHPLFGTSQARIARRSIRSGSEPRPSCGRDTDVLQRRPRQTRSFDP
jgi:hypothetical protein